MNKMSQIEQMLKELLSIKPVPKRILLQVPDGLRRQAPAMAGAIEAGFKEAKVIIWAGTCYGACDLPLNAAQAAKCDLIFHVGHVPFYRKIESKVPILYFTWEIEAPIDMKKVAAEAKKVKEKRIGLISSVQYFGILGEVSAILQDAGKEVIMASEPVLGCRASLSEKIFQHIDAFLFVGSGEFHPLGFDCKYMLDLEKQEIRDISAERAAIEKKRWARIAKAKEARTFGILISSKPGQYELQAKAAEVRAALERKDKKAFIAILDDITPGALEALAADAYINTACPRLAEDAWPRPVINARDLDKLLED